MQCAHTGQLSWLTRAVRADSSTARDTEPRRLVASRPNMLAPSTQAMKPAFTPASTGLEPSMTKASHALSSRPPALLCTVKHAVLGAEMQLLQ